MPGQLHAAVRVVRAGDGQPGHAVVTVAQQLDTEAAGVLGQTVKPPEQVVEDLDQLPRVTSGGES